MEKIKRTNGAHPCACSCTPPCACLNSEPKCGKPTREARPHGRQQHGGTAREQPQVDGGSKINIAQIFAIYFTNHVYHYVTIHISTIFQFLTHSGFFGFVTNTHSSREEPSKTSGEIKRYSKIGRNGQPTSKIWEGEFMNFFSLPF